MTLREMEIFSVVADSSSMSEAARKLYVSQSSVSQTIASIEKEYNVKLFERFAHTLVLTEQGLGLLKFSSEFLKLQINMNDYLMSFTDNRRIRIGATVTVGTCVIINLLDELKSRFPNLNSEVYIDNTYAIEGMLLKNEIDIGLVEGKISNKEIAFNPIIEDELVLACSRESKFYGYNEISASDLINRDFILREKGSGTRAAFESQIEALHIPINVCWVSNNSEAIKKAVISNYGITVISKMLIQKEIDDGLLWAAKVTGIEMKRHFSIAYRKGKYITEAMKEFIGECYLYSGNRNFGKV